MKMLHQQKSVNPKDLTCVMLPNELKKHLICCYLF